MSKEIFAHLAIHNGLELVDQFVFDQGGPGADCFSLVRLDPSAKIPSDNSRYAYAIRENARSPNEEVDFLKGQLAQLQQEADALRKKK